MIHRLWFRLLAAFVVVVVVSVAVTVLLTRQGAATQFQHFMLAGRMIRPERMQEVLAEHYSHHGGWQRLDVMFPQLAGGASDGPMTGMFGNMMGMHDNRVQVLDAQGVILADTSGSEPLTDAPVERWPILVDGAPVGELRVGGTLMGASPTTDAFVGGVTRAVLVAGAVAGLVALALAALLVRQFTRPLARLTQASHAIARGDLGVRVPVQTRDEFGELAATFNHMADNLETQENTRRQMMADIAHELRTPLAGIQGTVEALQDGIFLPNAENLQAIHQEALILNRLVEDLRTLANAEANQLRLERGPVDVGDLCRRQVNAQRAIAAERDVTLDLDVQDGLPLVVGDAQRLGQVLRNLLDNALRHTPAGGAVCVQAAAAGDALRITVTDTGEGIAPENLPHVFDRFYRSDRSRTRATGGSGLGLAIARQFVAAHGGNIEVASPPPGHSSGTQFTVVLPVG
jgi:signal transduction histidine kinase